MKWMDFPPLENHRRYTITVTITITLSPSRDVTVMPPVIHQSETTPRRKEIEPPNSEAFDATLWQQYQP
jgi:hypothetical protein